MNDQQLKKTAARTYSQLLAICGEKQAYYGFMRLCGLAFADRSALEAIMSRPEELRIALFYEKCRQLAEKYGGIFSLYGELSVPSALLSDGGAASELLSLPREVFAGDDAVLGWCHQYFNEPYRNEISVGLKSSKRLSTEKIAPATQIFTPDWVVRYMVDNTLGPYLAEHGYTAGSGELTFSAELKQAEKLPLEAIKLIDPCMGSGNVLLYAFDVFFEQYLAQGYTAKIAAEKVLKYNLFGLELDERARAAAETAIRVKAQKFGANTLPQVYDFAGVSENTGSLHSEIDLPKANEKAAIIGKLLGQKYAVVVTNPPYLGKPAMNEELSAYVRKNFADYSADLFSAFMARCLDMTENSGYIGFLTPATWLFLQSYEKLRKRIFESCFLQTLIHFEYSAFEAATVPLCSFTIKNAEKSGRGVYLRLSEFKGGMEEQRIKAAEAISAKDCGYRFEADTADFLMIPSAPCAYWLGQDMLRAFSGRTLGSTVDIREGLISGDNDRFLRRWYEVEVDRIAFLSTHKKRWYLLNKGGEYRKWYGNRLFVVNWENDGYEIKHFTDKNGKLRSRPQGLDYNFRPSVSWSQITSGAFSARYFDENFMFNVAGSSAFPHNEQQLMMLIGLLNSKVASELAQVLNPTLNMNPGDAARLPLPDAELYDADTEAAVRENIEICTADWDSFETSYGFKRHPLI
ncbi:Eco57I restriction-modification methylase domain-containing protein [Ruminococcus flavefaciens]|uniref:site-specific DNA-methyltransferase (adenine-specific) n=1 Tax=Ruminococcus flavefaciens TaxID=1265 RepID=A0A1M7J6M3_RUMFL|nr:N-6 DNA methylase [Ruminococcus flavefaciens]SHM48625.1 Methyltransferase domain-containing protein [Ruminococcus flavefaciens]